MIIIEINNFIIHDHLWLCETFIPYVLIESAFFVYLDFGTRNFKIQTLGLDQQMPNFYEYIKFTWNIF